MATLHIFIIHTECLTQRALRLHGVIQNIRVIAQQQGYEVRPFFVLSPSSNDIATKQDQYQSRLNYEPCGIADIDRTSKVLSVEILSNFEKHMKAWQLIAESDSDNAQDIYMIIEDDAFILPENIPNFGKLMNIVHEDPWDMLLLGVAFGNDKSEFCLQDTIKNFKLIPSKEAYLIKREAAQTMVKDFADSIKFSMRGQLSWYAATHPEFMLRNISHQVTLDGSKLGLTPSTIHESSVLIYNAEYMELLSYTVKSKEEITAAMPKINQLYDSVSQLKSPYISYIYSILLYKAGYLDQVGNVIMGALDMLTEQQGLLNSRNEILNTYIDMCRDMQTDLPDIFTLSSKYSGIV